MKNWAAVVQSTGTCLGHVTCCNPHTDEAICHGPVSTRGNPHLYRLVQTRKWVTGPCAAEENDGFRGRGISEVERKKRDVTMVKSHDECRRQTIRRDTGKAAFTPQICILIRPLLREQNSIHVRAPERGLGGPVVSPRPWRMMHFQQPGIDLCMEGCDMRG